MSQRQLDRQSRHLGLTWAQFKVVSYLLNDAEASVPTQTVLATALAIGRASLGELLSRLESAGYVKRHEDGRSRRIALTIAARKRLARIATSDPACLGTPLPGLSDAEVETLRDLLGRLKARLQD